MAWEFAIKFAWEWARDHGVVDRATERNGFLKAWTRWVGELPVRPVTARYYMSVGKKLSKIFDESCAAISRRSIAEYVKAEYDKGLKANSIKNYLTVIKMFFRWAEVENYVDENPTRLIKAPRGPVRTGIALTLDEARHLLKCATKKEIRKHKKYFKRYYQSMWLYWFVLIGLHTGLRKSNLLRLCWSEIDLHERRIDIPGSKMKNRKPLAVPIHPELELRLRCYKPYRASNIVLGREMKDIHKSWGQLVRRAGMPELRIHDLRHTVSTWWGMAMPWHYSETILGRALRGTGGIYFHPPFEELRNKIDELPEIDGRLGLADVDRLDLSF
jgi:integrase